MISFDSPGPSLPNGRPDFFLMLLGQLLLLTVSPDDLVLYRLDATEAARSGAVCLDGSPPGFWFRNASVEHECWVLYMQGGAWCSTPASCASRAQGHLGNSSEFSPTYYMEGVLDSKPDSNPTFHGWNHVLLAYCDGASFSGDAESGLSWPDPGDPSRNMTLYFRGRRVLRALVQTLISRFGMSTAQEVMLSGGSAGGLATFLQADFVGGLLPPSVRKYRAVPISGFFLMHETLTGATAFPDAMRATYELHNATVSPSCAASVPSGEAWRCFFANYSFTHAQTPSSLLRLEPTACPIACPRGVRVARRLGPPTCSVSSYPTLDGPLPRWIPPRWIPPRWIPPTLDPSTLDPSTLDPSTLDPIAQCFLSSRRSTSTSSLQSYRLAVGTLVASTAACNVRLDPE